MGKYCLIGEKLSHSYSAIIHKEFGYPYSLKELKLEEVKSFAKNCEYDGYNVTIPYKKEIMQYLDVIDPIAMEIGAVNTVKIIDKKSYGFNTDILGMEYLLSTKGISLTDKKVIILGSGGTSQTAKALAKMKKARETVIISRNGNDNYDNISRHYDAEVIINTTPIGMYPNNGQKLIDINKFGALESVFDAIYNPLLTSLLFDAKEKGINYTSGLKMLVAQAKFARDIFAGDIISDEVIENIYKKLYLDTVNIVLIGMPSSGKTTIGKALSAIFDKQFVDTDIEIEKAFCKSVTQIFLEDGEKAFRAKEKNMLEKFGKEKGQIISIGGGAVNAENAYRNLKQNGIIIYLNRDLNKLDTIGRPLLQNNGAEVLSKLYNERQPIYEKFADITADNNGKIEETIKFVKEKIYENIGD